MRLKLERHNFGVSSTLGTLYHGGQAVCFVLEDKDRHLEEYPDAKVQGETCIPRGSYDIIVTWSARFNKELPLLVDVPGFAGIRIHPGNTHMDTEGCLLPGTSYAENGGDYVVNNSREAFRRLNALIEGALDRGETVTLEVV